MEALSQLDVTAPDHISVITRDGKVTISVLKDGTSVTLGFPIRSPWIDGTPRPPLQQSTPVMVKRQETPMSASGDSSASTKSQITYKAAEEIRKAQELGKRFQSKLTESQVIEMKQILADPEIMAKFSSKTQAYKQLGQIYGVSGCRVQQIANGNGWNHVKI